MRQAAQISASSSSARSTEECRELGAMLAWLLELIETHGAGEYLLTVRSDGSVRVKRPRKPLEFHFR